ncbi:Crp/Fnr family transcriptional regulator [Sphingomonas sp. PB2P12]|uniref:Crp/Fnr family transcriptional regulator n=1 Tax=Sphingomonas sandaracina TaxID=3096157 RepID=UPI002FC8E16D
MHDLEEGPLAGMADKLATQAILSDEDRAALLKLPHASRSFEPGSYLVREGDVTNTCAVLVSGFAYRHKTSSNGGRQIVGILFPGDLLDLQQLHINVADHNIQTLTRCEVTKVPQSALRAIIRDRPSISDAIVTSVLIEGSIMREWLLNIGRRDARTRVAHFLCEFVVRLNRQDLVLKHTHHLPMTQEQLGDALGLTAVHINRTLKVLETEGFITRDKQQGFAFPKWKNLCTTSDFNSRYLHGIMEII